VKGPKSPTRSKRIEDNHRRDTPRAAVRLYTGHGEAWSMVRTKKKRLREEGAPE